MKLYISLIPRLTLIARVNGYALGVHGSLTRDLDVILVPWVDWAKNASIDKMFDEIEKEMTKICGWVSWVEPKSETKSHGRKAHTLILHDYETTDPEWRKPFIDISVMPTK